MAVAVPLGGKGKIENGIKLHESLTKKIFDSI